MTAKVTGLPILFLRLIAYNVPGRCILAKIALCTCINRAMVFVKNFVMIRDEFLHLPTGFAAYVRRWQLEWQSLTSGTYFGLEWCI